MGFQIPKSFTFFIFFETSGGRWQAEEEKKKVDRVWLFDFGKGIDRLVFGGPERKFQKQKC